MKKKCFACLFTWLLFNITLVIAEDWPQFRGLNRDGKSPETGLLKQWLEGGPNLLRTISGFGDGFSSPVVAGKRIHISGKVGNDLKLFCYDLTGNKIWEQTHGPAFLEEHAPHSPYPGSRGSATLDGDLVYLVGGLGRLAAYRSGTGEPVWSVDYVSDLGGRVPPWGFTESVLIDGDKLICTPGSEQAGTFAALNKATGKVLWRSVDVTERAEYGSPILIEDNGVRQVVTMSRSGLVAVSPEDGKFLWQHNRMAKKGTPETTTAHGNSPAYADGMLYCFSEKGRMGLIESQPDQFKQISTFDVPAGTGPSWTHPVIRDGKLYLRWNDKLYVYRLNA